MPGRKRKANDAFSESTDITKYIDARVKELDLEVESKCEQLKLEASFVTNMLNSSFRRQLRTLPKEIREMNLHEFLEKYGGIVSNFTQREVQAAEKEFKTWVAETPRVLTARKKRRVLRDRGEVAQTPSQAMRSKTKLSNTVVRRSTRKCVRKAREAREAKLAASNKSSCSFSSFSSFSSSSSSSSMPYQTPSQNSRRPRTRASTRRVTRSMRKAQDTTSKTEAAAQMDVDTIDQENVDHSNIGPLGVDLSVLGGLEAQLKNTFAGGSKKGGGASQAQKKAKIAALQDRMAAITQMLNSVQAASL